MKTLELGQILLTPGVHSLVTESDSELIPLVMRHMRGDWGDIDSHDRKVNREAVKNGDRVLSAYVFNNAKVWIITEADRSVTTILLPEEY